MIKTARLSIPYEKNQDMANVLSRYLTQCGLTRADIDVHSPVPTYGTTTHFGNWILVPVLNNFASQKLAQTMGNELDFFDSILEQADIDTFHVGDKVRVKYIGELGMGANNEGTVSAKENNEIIIRKKRSKKYGWRFKPGDQVNIEKIA